MTDEQLLEMALRQGSLDGPRPPLVLFPVDDDPDEPAHESYAIRYGGSLFVGYVPWPCRSTSIAYMHAVGLLPSYFERGNMMRPAQGDGCRAPEGHCDGSCGVPR